MTHFRISSNPAWAAAFAVSNCDFTTINFQPTAINRRYVGFQILQSPFIFAGTIADRRVFNGATAGSLAVSGLLYKRGLPYIPYMAYTFDHNQNPTAAGKQ